MFRECAKKLKREYENDQEFIEDRDWTLKDDKNFEAQKWLTLVSHNDLRYIFDSYDSDDKISLNCFKVFEDKLKEEELLYSLTESLFFKRTPLKIKLLLSKCQLTDEDKIFLLLPTSEEQICFENIHYILEKVDFSFLEKNKEKCDTVKAFFDYWDTEALNLLWEKYPFLEETLDKFYEHEELEK